jgi:hypothetical protein
MMSFACVRGKSIEVIKSATWAAGGGAKRLSLGQQPLTCIPLAVQRGCSRELLDRADHQTHVAEGFRIGSGRLKLFGNVACDVIVEPRGGQPDPCTQDASAEVGTCGQ